MIVIAILVYALIALTGVYVAYPHHLRWAVATSRNQNKGAILRELSIPLIGYGFGAGLMFITRLIMLQRLPFSAEYLLIHSIFPIVYILGVSFVRRSEFASWARKKQVRKNLWSAHPNLHPRDTEEILGFASDQATFPDLVSGPGEFTNSAGWRFRIKQITLHENIVQFTIEYPQWKDNNGEYLTDVISIPTHMLHEAEEDILKTITVLAPNTQQKWLDSLHGTHRPIFA